MEASGMEFFRTANIAVSLATLYKSIDVLSCPQFCPSIEEIVDGVENEGEANTIWGVYKIERMRLKLGLRFSMPDCPNAMQWTITTDDAQQGKKVTIHCTINHQTHDPDFVASLDEFVAEWKDGLEQHF